MQVSKPGASSIRRIKPWICRCSEMIADPGRMMGSGIGINRIELPRALCAIERVAGTAIYIWRGSFVRKFILCAPDALISMMLTDNARTKPFAIIAPPPRVMSSKN